MFGALTFLPFFFQDARGLSPPRRDCGCCRSWAGCSLASIGSGQLVSRWGRYKVFPVVGTFLMIVGLLLMSRIGLSTGEWTIAGYLFVFGVGLGLVMQILVVAVQNAVAYEQLGTATSGATFFRMIGGSFGTAVFGAIFANLLATNVVHALHLQNGPTQSEQLAERSRPDFAGPAPPGHPRRSGGGHGAHDPDRVPHRRADRRGGVRVCRGSCPRSSCARSVRNADPGKELGMHESRTSLDQIQLALERFALRENRAELYPTLAARAGLQLDPRSCWLLYRFADRPDCTLESMASRLKVDPETHRGEHRRVGGYGARDK